MSVRSVPGATGRGPLQGEARSMPFRCPLENKSSEISGEAADGIARGQNPQIRSLLNLVHGSHALARSIFWARTDRPGAARLNFIAMYLGPVLTA